LNPDWTCEISPLPWSIKTMALSSATTLISPLPRIRRVGVTTLVMAVTARAGPSTPVSVVRL
jgi:hypothetical protein